MSARAHRVDRDEGQVDLPRLDRFDHVAGGVEQHQLDGQAEAACRPRARGPPTRRAARRPRPRLARIGLPKLMAARSLPVAPSSRDRLGVGFGAVLAQQRASATSARGAEEVGVRFHRSWPGQRAERSNIPGLARAPSTRASSSRSVRCAPRTAIGQAVELALQLRVAHRPLQRADRVLDEHVHAPAVGEHRGDVGAGLVDRCRPPSPPPCGAAPPRRGGSRSRRRTPPRRRGRRSGPRRSRGRR